MIEIKMGEHAYASALEWLADIWTGRCITSLDRFNVMIASIYDVDL